MIRNAPKIGKNFAFNESHETRLDFTRNALKYWPFMAASVRSRSGSKWSRHFPFDLE